MKGLMKRVNDQVQTFTGDSLQTLFIAAYLEYLEDLAVSILVQCLHENFPQSYPGLPASTLIDSPNPIDRLLNFSNFS